MSLSYILYTVVVVVVVVARSHDENYVLLLSSGFCGSCWAFSLISSVESHWFIANGQSVNLPEQFVNDCAWSFQAHACK